MLHGAVVSWYRTLSSKTGLQYLWDPFLCLLSFASKTSMFMPRFCLRPQLISRGRKQEAHRYQHTTTTPHIAEGVNTVDQIAFLPPPISNISKTTHKMRLHHLYQNSCLQNGTVQICKRVTQIKLCTLQEFINLYHQGRKIRQTSHLCLTCCSERIVIIFGIL